MQKRILLFAACAALAMAVSAPLDSAGFDITTYAVPMVAIACIGLAAWLAAPAVAFVARHVKQAMTMSLQPGGRSPAVAMIAAKARSMCMLARERITVTSSWRMCPST